MVFGPIIGHMAAWRAWRCERLHCRLILVSSCIVVLVGAAGAIGVRTSSVEANFALVLMGYLALTMLVPNFHLLPQSWLRLPAFLAGYVILLAGFLLGISGTALLLLPDVGSPPRAQETLRPGLTCSTTDWGGFGGGGYTFHLYRYLPWFPFLRLEVATASYDASSATTDVSISCGDHFATDR